MAEGSWIHRKYTTPSRFLQGNSGRNSLFEIVNAIVYAPPSAAVPTGQRLLRLDQVGPMATWAAEEASTFGLGTLPFRPGLKEDAGGKLQRRCGPLQ